MVRFMAESKVSWQNLDEMFSDTRKPIVGTPWWVSDLSTMADEVRDRTIIVKIKSQLHSWSDLDIRHLLSEFGMVEEVKFLPVESEFHSQVRFQTIYDSEWAYYYYQDGWFVHQNCCEIQIHRADDVISWNTQRIDKIKAAYVVSDTPKVTSVDSLLMERVKQDKLITQGEESSQFALKDELNSAKEPSDRIAHQVLEEMPKSIVTHEVKFLDEIGKKIDELVDGFDLKAPPIGSVERLDDAGEEKELIQVEGSEPVVVKEISDFTAHRVLEEMSQSTETIEVNLTGVLTKDDEDDDDLLEMASWIEEDFEPPTYTKGYMRLMCFDPGGSVLKSNDHVVSELGLMIHVIQFGVEINETRHQRMKMKDPHVIIVAAKLGVVVMDVQRAAPFTLGFDPACLSSAAYMSDMIIRFGMASVTAPFLIFIFDPGAESMEQEYKSDIFGERGILLSVVHGIVEDGNFIEDLIVVEGNFIEDSEGKISMPSYLSDFNVAPSSSDAEAGNVLPSGTPYPPNPMKMKMLQLSKTSFGDNNHFTGWKIQGEDEQDFPAGDLTGYDFTDSFMGGFSYMQDPSVVLHQGIAAEISVLSDLASFNEKNNSEAEIVEFPSNLPAQKLDKTGIMASLSSFLAEPETVKFLCGRLLDQSQPISERFRVLFSLRNLKGKEPRDALIQATRDPSNLLAHEAAFALGQIQDAEAVPALESILNDLSLHPIVRHEAAEALGAIGLESNIPLLKKSLVSDPALEVRETCELALHRIEEVSHAGTDEKEASPFLSVDPAAAASCSSLSQLREVLLDEDKGMYERYAALFALRNHGGEEAVSAIIDSLGAKSALLKHEVAYVLGQLQNKAASAALTGILKDETEHPMVRHEAAEALGSIADDQSVALLEQFSKDPEPIVSQSCEVALSMLEFERSGKSFEYLFMQTPVL